ncbi:MAG: DUF72 domain-containing protein [Sphingobacteriales bacterium]|nr:MAG: DUF72 domain-containing protein [Sphingobacteriales bacterium]
MNFGWLDPEALSGKSFPLPADPVTNQLLLRRAQSAQPLKIQVGLAEWHVKEWKGRLYPARTREADVMDAYMQRYRCIEFNGTHYRIYPPDTIRKWAEKAVHDDFSFLPKFPQLISHHSQFVNPVRDTALFLDSVAAFGTHLGPLFIQTGEHFAPTRINQEHLYRYLGTLPRPLTVFVEFRHPDWFTDPVLGIWTETFRDLGIGAVITDTPGRRDACHMQLTIPKVLVRFVGKSRVASTYARIEEWMQRIKGWERDGLEEAYFIVHSGLSAPEMSRYVIARVNEILGQTIPDPQLSQPLFNPFDDAVRYGLIATGQTPVLDQPLAPVQMGLF